MTQSCHRSTPARASVALALLLLAVSGRAVAQPERDEAERLRLFNEDLRRQDALEPTRTKRFRLVEISDAPLIVRVVSIQVPVPLGEIALAESLNPSEALTEPGLYLGVLDDRDRYIYVRRVDRERVVRSEHFVKDDVTGESKLAPRFATIRLRRQWIVPEGRARLFKVDDQGKAVLFEDEPDPPRLLSTSRRTPKLYAVRDEDAESLERSEIYNVIFMGAGFKKRELDAYRGTVKALVVELMGMAPFCHYADRLGFYRIDVVDPELAEDNCPSTCNETGKLSVPAGFDVDRQAAVAREGRPIVKTKLDVVRCWQDESEIDGNGDCSLYWMLDESKILNLAAAPGLPFNAVVIVLNVNDAVGAGPLVSQLGEVGVAVVGTTLDDEGRVDSERLFAHELGHCLGMLDEYGDETSFEYEFPTDRLRNLWWEGQANPWLSDPGCSVEELTACCGARPPGGGECTMCEGLGVTCAYASATCQFVDLVLPPRDVPPECEQEIEEDLCLPDVCTGAILWEGGFYQLEGYFRSRARCMMSDTAQLEFCEGCAYTLNETICTLTGIDGCPNAAETLRACPPRREDRGLP